MSDFLLTLSVFVCGSGLGFIVAAFLAVGARHEENTFDGGFSHDHPPVRTVIWSKHVNNKED